MNYRKGMKKPLGLLLILLLLSTQLFAFRFEYNKDLDTLGDVGMYVSLALPATDGRAHV